MSSSSTVSQAPARVNLCVTTLLAMSTSMASIQSSLPPVAYTKVTFNRTWVLDLANLAPE